MEKIKRIDRSLVYKGAWISMYTDSMAFANGNFANWDFIHHNGAAAMVAEDADGRIIMIRQWRPGAEGEILELPAGESTRVKSRCLRRYGSFGKRREPCARKQSHFL